MRKIITMLILVLMSFSDFAKAGEIDKLVQHLMKEGVIKPENAQLILTEPSWVQNMRIGGDLRFRYQNEDKGSCRRERARIRFRLKGEAKPSQDWLVGWGFATGGSDPRSTNQTLDAGFSTKSINLDYAYGVYEGIKGLNVKMGKIPVKKAIQRHGDLLWDSDIGVEGLVMNYMSNPDKVQFFSNLNYLIMNYVSNGNGAGMIVVQPGVIAKLGGGKKLKLNVAQYTLSGAKEAPTFAASADAGASNTLAGGDYLYDYNCMSVGFDLSFEKLYFEEVLLFGEYVSNPDPSEENTGMLIGVGFGAKKVKSCGQWQAKIIQRSLGKDSWMDWLSDSDARDGKTDTAGSEFILTYGLAKNVMFEIDYYISGEAKEEVGDKKYDLAQFDLIFKF